MIFNYIVMSCKKENGSIVEFPIIFPSKMNGFEIQEALQNSDEVFEIYESSELVSYGIVDIGPNGVSCKAQSQGLIDMFNEFPDIQKILHSREKIDEELIKKSGE